MVESVISFFDCSKPKFPPTPTSQTLKHVILGEEIPTRPPAGVPREELEDPDKKSIYVIYQVGLLNSIFHAKQQSIGSSLSRLVHLLVGFLIVQIMMLGK